MSSFCAVTLFHPNCDAPLRIERRKFTPAIGVSHPSENVEDAQERDYAATYWTASVISDAQLRGIKASSEPSEHKRPIHERGIHRLERRKRDAHKQICQIVKGKSGDNQPWP
jgi:hypothetical protein